MRRFAVIVWALLIAVGCDTTSTAPDLTDDEVEGVVGRPKVDAPVSETQGFDRNTEDFVVKLSDVELGPDDSLSLGYHPTDAPVRLRVNEPQGDLLICAVDSVGVLDRTTTVEVPPCNIVDDGEVELIRRDGRTHVALGLRSRTGGQAREISLIYQQADGYFVIFYSGEEREFRLSGPIGSTPRVANTTEGTIIVDGQELRTGNALPTESSDLVLRVGSGTTNVAIDWFDELGP